MSSRTGEVRSRMLWSLLLVGLAVETGALGARLPSPALPEDGGKVGPVNGRGVLVDS